MAKRPVREGIRDEARKRVLKEAFLELLEHMRPTAAADALEISTSALYRWKRDDEEFAHAWDEIVNGPFLDRIESVLAQNALAERDNFAAICILNARHPVYRSARASRDSDFEPTQYAEAMRSYLEAMKASIEPPPDKGRQDEESTRGL